MPAGGTVTPLRLAMWSGPRTISTAMMRAFENRPDTRVWDEPFYAHYLRQSGLGHPGRDEIIAAHDAEWPTVVDALVGPPPDGAPVFYQKHMTHHLLPHIGRDWLDQVVHAFLIRDPVEVLASYSKVRADVTLDDLGLEQQVEIFDHVQSRRDGVPPVLDAADVLKDPERLLTLLCEAVGLDFRPAMLAWPAGPRDSDGVWAGHWYAAVEMSTGFKAYTPENISLPSHLMPLAKACAPYYDRLYEHRLGR